MAKRPTKPAQRDVREKLRYKPHDWLSGGVKLGDKYKAWDTYGQGRPDKGVGAGPGEPYHVVEKRVQKPSIGRPQIPKWGGNPRDVAAGNYPKRDSVKDARLAAIRRRLGWS